MTDTLTLFQSRNDAAKRHQFFAGVLLFVIALLPSLPALHGEYIWDDFPWLVNNSAVRAPNGLLTIWNPHYTQTISYPLTLTTFWIEFRLWGLASIGYHLVNVVLHACSVVVLWRVLKRLDLKAAWAISLLWGIHPVQVESVAWVTELKNVLSGLFYFLAVAAYLKFERIGESPETAKRRWSFYVLALVAFAAGLLSKSAICTMPAALAIVLWWKRGLGSPKAFFTRYWPLVPLFFIGLGFAAFTALQEKNNFIDATSLPLQFTFLQRVIIAGKDICFYIERLIFPYPLMPLYPKWNLQTTNPVNFLPAATTALLGLLLWTKQRAWGRGPFAGYAYFLIALSPTLGFINFTTMTYCFVEDHFQYLACLGVIAVVVESCGTFLLANHATPKNRPAIAKTLFTACAILLLAASCFYASLYQSNLKLWSWNTQHNSLSYGAHHNLADSYYLLNRKTEAYAEIEVALAIAPDDQQILQTAGQFALERKEYDKAISYFQHGLVVNPTYGQMDTFTGDAYTAMGQPSDALTFYKKGVTLSPNDPKCLYPCIRALVAAKKLADAEPLYGRLIAIVPGNLILRNDFGNLLLDLDKPLDAIEQYQFVLRYQQNSSLIWDNLAAAYYKAGRMNEAVYAKKKARALDAAPVNKK